MSDRHTSLTDAASQLADLFLAGLMSRPADAVTAPG
jgi:hypothetical protein